MYIIFQVLRFAQNLQRCARLSLFCRLSFCAPEPRDIALLHICKKGSRFASAPRTENAYGNYINVQFCFRRIGLLRSSVRCAAAPLRLFCACVHTPQTSSLCAPSPNKQFHLSFPCLTRESCPVHAPKQAAVVHSLQVFACKNLAFCSIKLIP